MTVVASVLSFFFFFNDTATTEIYTLSLHDALPILFARPASHAPSWPSPNAGSPSDRKSTRLNSSHVSISYAVFCLKKKKTRYYAEASRRGRSDRASVRRGPGTR